MKSNERAANAIKDGRLADEIVPVAVPQRKGDPILVETRRGRPPGHDDGEPRLAAAGVRPQRHDHRRQRFAARRRRQRRRGDVERAEAERRGVAPLGEVVSYGMVAGPDNASLLHQPSRAILKAAERAGIAVGDIDLFEINEAFAAVGIASIAELGIRDEIVNVNGGAIALGHPIGMSGNRLALTMLHELRRRGGGVGAVALCGGGGQGDAAIVRSL